MKLMISIQSLFFILLFSSCSSETNKELSKSFGVQSTLTYSERQGKFLYAKYCTVCHGAEGEGDGFNAFNLDPKPRNFSDSDYMSNFSDDRLFETISQGGRGINKSVMMPSWKSVLKDYQVIYLVSYLRLFTNE